jgi:hypothetical protein
MIGAISAVLKENQMPPTAGLIVMGRTGLVALRTFKSSAAISAYFQLRLVG